MLPEQIFRKSFMDRIVKKIQRHYAFKNDAEKKQHPKPLQARIKPKDYVRIYNEAICRNWDYSNTLIQPELLGESITSVCSKYGRPLSKAILNEISIREYPLQLMGTTASCKVHAFKNQCFFIELTFEELSLNKLYEIFDLATEKYGCELDMDQNTIIDSKGNMFFFSDTAFGFRFSYMSDLKRNGIYSFFKDQLPIETIENMNSSKHYTYKLQNIL